MFTQSPIRDRWISLFIAASLLFTALLPFSVFAQDRKRKPIVVSFGQPNIWSLEQAHYLLARMHMTNLELQAKALTDSDLDPNATHGTRIQILKQLLEISGAYDQTIGFQNQRLVESARFNDDRRRRLITDRDRLREQSLQLELEKNELTRERKKITDDTSDRAKDLDAQIEEKTKDQEKIEKQVDFQNDEIQKLGAEPSGTPTAPTPSASPFDKTRLPSSILDNLTKDELDKLLDPGRDPKLNATTMLDNTVQLQYEIIAKQLTLLRDEVGPGERLVFLELPQSIYTTPDSSDEKMAQTWWHVNGYTHTDPLVRILLELLEVELKWQKIQEVDAYKRQKRNEDVEKWQCDEKAVAPEKKGEYKATKEILEAKKESDPILKLFVSLKCEREGARKAVLRSLYQEANSLFSRVEQNGSRNTDELVEAIRKVIDSRKQEKPQPEGGQRVQIDVDAKRPRREQLLSSSFSHTVEEERRYQIEQLKNRLLTILSADTLPANALQNLERDFNVRRGHFEQAMEFIRLDDDAVPTKDGRTDIQRRTVRTVDIIPRQSSLNVNDVQETVKATGILAAFKFLFGFAGQVNYQRQREQFEQFVHQELYASGFGKGNRDFGWTFGAVPGTKRLAPGVRTTYAALVVPQDAESIVLSARGCYFPRKSFQPLDFEDTGHNDWSNDDKFRRYNCGEQQSYILPVPGGGDTSNFWVTSIDYEDGKEDGQFVTVSVRGNNFSSQMGVLVDGVPLSASVGLAQPGLMPKKLGADGTVKSVAEDCATSSRPCGSYERIDPEQIIFSFKMPDDYTGIPTITLVAPGKAVDLNDLSNLRINKNPNVKLKESAFMFGTRPSEVLSIKDLQLLNDTAGPMQKALLVGTKFDSTKDIIYVNGSSPATKRFISANVYELTFPVSDADNIKVTIVQDKSVVSKTVPNPAASKLAKATVVEYKPAMKDKPAIVRIEGTGFRAPIHVDKIEGAKVTRAPVVSANGIVLRLLDPQPPVYIKVSDATGTSVTAVVEELPAVKEEPKQNPKPKPNPKPKKE